MIYVMYVCQFLGVEIIYYKRLHLESQELALSLSIYIYIFIYFADLNFGLHIEGALCTFFYVQSQFRSQCEIELVACSSF